MEPNKQEPGINLLGKIFEIADVNPCTDEYRITGGCGVLILIIQRAHICGYITITKRFKYDATSPDVLVPFNPLKLSLHERQDLAWRLRNVKLKLADISAILGVGLSTTSNDIKHKRARLLAQQNAE